MQWEFEHERGEPNRWRWKTVAEGTRETLRMSQLSFRTREECIRNAEKHGYAPLAGPPPSAA
jgi:hypothetical protein